MNADEIRRAFKHQFGREMHGEIREEWFEYSIPYRDPDPNDFRRVLHVYDGIPPSKTKKVVEDGHISRQDEDRHGWAEEYGFISVPIYKRDGYASLLNTGIFHRGETELIPSHGLDVGGRETAGGEPASLQILQAKGGVYISLARHLKPLIRFVENTGYPAILSRRFVEDGLRGFLIHPGMRIRVEIIDFSRRKDREARAGVPTDDEKMAVIEATTKEWLTPPETYERMRILKCVI